MDMDYIKRKIKEKEEEQKFLEEQTKKDIEVKLAFNIEENNIINNDVLEDKAIHFNKIVEFEDNPFKKYTDEDLEELKESIKDNGLLNPIILWKTEDKYTILSGHNRFLALKNLEYEKLDSKMYKVLEDISLEDAKLIVVDTNLIQRKNLLPSEKAKAYKIQKEMLEKNNSKRSVNFEFFQEENALNTGEIAEDKNLCHDVNLEKNRSIYRYLRLNYLRPEFLKKVDDKEISLVMGVELSYLKEDEQKEVFTYFFERDNFLKLNLEICKNIREKAKSIKISKEVLDLIIEKYLKPKTSRSFKINFKNIKEISSREIKTDKEAKDYIMDCIKFYEENKNKEM
ncbi:ParB N-terminal domain-containing protein [uncultured Tyzzerella sp.]|uniref:ParB/RepB/Spo0J family partition protein n=1 Tax=uncultured Tyzzerella sp. TaxID=2321398 RepID=UPI002941F595|nr:ParB N-terminal domain-containing protein [uncultured Tyzzerella sp.]